MNLIKGFTFLIFFISTSLMNIGIHLKTKAMEISELNINELSKEINLSDKQVYSVYTLGAGDAIYIRFLGAPFFNGMFAINNEGFLSNLPELNSLYVRGYSLKELEKELTNKYKEYLYDPSLNLTISKYRPISVYVYGEIKRPGLYKFKGNYIKIKNNNNSLDSSFEGMISYESMDQEISDFNITRLFDVIQKANGVSNYADLSKIIIIRNNPINQGGGKIKAELNLLTLLENGDHTQNIRIFDGDSIFINKGEKMIKEQILNINRSNISPEILTVFITGNVFKPGTVNLKQGSSLLQAVASSGGKKLLTGKIEFIRFNDDGTTLKYSFNYDQNAPINSRKNPILMSGDIINVRKTILGQSSSIIGEISSPVVGAYGLYKIFAD